MKNLLTKITLTLSFSLLLGIYLFAQTKVVASNNIVTKDIPIEKYNAIEVLGIPTVTYSQSTDDSPKLRIKASDNLIDLLICEVKNGVLSVKMKSGYRFTITNSKTKLHIYTSSKDINCLAVKGSGDIIVEDVINTPELMLQVNGSGDISCNKIVCSQSLQGIVNGSGDISVNQIDANNLKLTVNGSGDFAAQKISSNQSNYTVNGSGDITLNKASAKNSLSATVNGSGDLQINKGSDCNVLNVAVNGSGDMTIAGINAITTNGSVHGSGDLYLSGSSKSAKYSLKNSGEINATSLVTDDVVTSLNGSGNIKCNAKKSLVSNINGSGNVRYKGNAQVTNQTKRKAVRM